MTALSAPPLRESLRRLRCLLNSPNASALTADELGAALRLCESFPIEVAESRASAKQLAFQAAFLARADESGRKCSIYTAMGGNRSGKSIVAGWLCFAKYLRDIARDGDWFWCVGQNLDRSVGGQQRELWNALPRWMFGHQRWDEKLGFGQHRKITLPTADGGRCLVEFRSADQDPSTFEQAKLTGVWIDERCGESIYNRLLARIIDRDGWILYSDIPEQFWQFTRLANAEPGAGVYYQRFGMRDNAANLPSGAIDQAALRMTEDERKLRIDGDFVVMEGVVYREFRDSRHVIEPFAIPADWPRWRFLDYGGSSPTACGWAAIAPNDCIYLYREHYERGRSIADNARMIVAASAGEKYVSTLIDPHAFDHSPANERNIADQYSGHGIDAAPWPYVNVMGEHAMVQRVKYILEQDRRIKVFANLPNFIREFKTWKYKVDKNGQPVASDAFEDGNNHLLDGLKGWIATSPCWAGGKSSAIKVYGRGGVANSPA